MPINKRMRLVLFRSSRQLRTLALCICLVFALPACSPKLDWRTIKNDSLNYAALFPGKPQLIDRTLSYQNSQLKQSLQFVKVDDDTPPAFNQVKESSAKAGPTNQQKQASQDYFLDLPQAKRVIRIRWITRPITDGGLYLYQVSVVRAQSTSNSKLSLESVLEQESINIFFDEFRPN
jgi:hypothetical protein